MTPVASFRLFWLWYEAKAAREDMGDQLGGYLKTPHERERGQAGAKADGLSRWQG